MNRFLKAVAIGLGALGGAVALLQLLPTPASPAALAEAEARMLSVVRAPHEQRFVQAGEHRLNTLIVGEGSKPPLVMLHGHGGGIAVFAQNFDVMAESYTVYAVDLLGWGRSDRPPFAGRTAEEARAFWVESLEAWRAEMGLDRMTLLGHSMGGFVAGSYALAHPDSVEHLILVDSGGFSVGVHPLNGIYFNLPPQRVVRWAGPLGPALVTNGREVEVARVPYPEGALIDYYYQISAAPGSGEVAFRKLLGLRAWALPLLDELHALPMATTLIWGENDALVSPENGRRGCEIIPRCELILIPDAAHSPFSEAPDAFHRAILDSPFRVGR